MISRPRGTYWMTGKVKKIIQQMQLRMSKKKEEKKQGQSSSAEETN